MLRLAVGALKTIYRRLVIREYNYLDLKHHNKKIRVGLIYLNHSYEIFEPRKCSKIWREKTAIVDLTKAESEIFAKYNDTSRNEIRKAVKDGVSYSISLNPSSDEINELLFAAGDLFKLKQMPVHEPSFYFLYRDRGELVITKTLDKTGEPLTYHAFLRRGTIALLVTSLTIRADRRSSRDKNYAGRANRLNHWEDAKKFKELGIERLDLGGWGKNQQDEKLKETSGKFSQFKLSLGAESFDVYYQLIPISIIAKILMKVRKSPG